MKRLSINQVLLIVIIATLLPIGALGVFQSFNNRNYVQELVGERLVSSALATAAIQRDPFVMAERMLASYSTDADVVGMTPQCSAVLARGLTVQKAVINFARIDAAGEVKCSALPLRAPISNAEQPWWRAGRTQQRYTIHGPITGRITGREVFAAMLPLRSRDGLFIGAVSAAIDVSWLEQTLKQKKLSPNAVAAIIDARGKPLASSGRRDLPVIDVSRSNGQVAAMTAPDGSQWLYASAPLYGDQLYIAYAELRNPLLQPIRTQLLTNLALPITAILLTCAAVWLALQRYLGHWLQRLRRLANQFAQGNFEHEPGQFAHAPREIAALGADLSNMAVAIDRRDYELSQSALRNRAMAREVNHRIKNNLQLVVSLIELQTSGLAAGVAREAFVQTRRRVSAIALIHRLLYEKGESSEHGEVEFDRLMIDLCAQLRGSEVRPGIDLRYSGALGTVPVDLAMPLILFAVEGISNAYRCDFSGVSDPTISVVVDGGTDPGRLTISHNGSSIGEDDDLTMSRQLKEAYATQVDGRITRTRDEAGKAVIMLDYRWRLIPSAVR